MNQQVAPQADADRLPEVAIYGLTKTFSGTPAVDNVTLEVARGEFVALLGPSGCGKSTTLRAVAGFVEPDQGRIVIRGRDITTVPPNQRNTAMVFQSYALFPHLTVSQNVSFGLRMRKIKPVEIARRVESALALVHLNSLGGRYPRQLSGGQQQRVALARALVVEPDVLLLDEPLSNLDAKLREEMRIEIRDLTRHLGATALYVTHDQAEALSMADRVVVMNQGQIAQAGTPDEVYEAPSDLFVATFMGDANVLPVTVQQADGADYLVRLGSGMTFPVRAASGFVERGANVLLIVRPERVLLWTNEPPPEALGLTSRASGRLKDLTYLGAAARYSVLLDDGSLIRAQLAAGSLQLNPGDPVVVSWAPQHARLLAQTPS